MNKQKSKKSKQRSGLKTTVVLKMPDKSKCQQLLD